MSLGLIALNAFVLGLLAYLLNRVLARRARGASPPGPKGWPLIGNVLDMPPSHEWKTFTEWEKKWGDIIMVNLVGQPIVILNSYQHSIDLLDKKSAIYSGRPVLVVGGEMVGLNNILTLLQNGPLFREHRRLYSQVIGSRSKVLQLTPLLETHAQRFLLRVLRDPSDVSGHLRNTTAATMLELVYGYHIKEVNDTLVRTVENGLNVFSKLTAPGAFLADVLPFLRHIPAWVPGAGWKKNVKTWTQTIQDVIDVPFIFVKEQMAAGTALPSLISARLAEGLNAEKENTLKMTAASFYGGGADTTVSLTRAFFLTMMCYPEIQRKAQLEIDEVVGGGRLPELGDWEHLPYVNALLLEVMRWSPVVPLAVVHRSSEDDVHGGYFIEKGTLVIPNVWKFLHDPEEYSNPFEFNPDRFMRSAMKLPQRDPRDFVYGFGRRICPGRHLADAFAFIICAMSLAVFDISKPTENGVTVEPKMEYTSGTIVHPLPFKCSITPRSAKAAGLIYSMNGSTQG